jgi:hypothetical protein
MPQIGTDATITAVSGNLEPEAVNELHGDAHEQNQARGAIRFGRPDRCRQRDQGKERGEAGQRRGTGVCESAGKDDALIIEQRHSSYPGVEDR